MAPGNKTCCDNPCSPQELNLSNMLNSAKNDKIILTTCLPPTT